MGLPPRADAAGRGRWRAAPGLRRAFASAVKRAELPSDLRQHELRHRRVTAWLAEGQSPLLVQKALEHADLATTMGYTHLVDDDVLALVIAIQQLYVADWAKEVREWSIRRDSGGGVQDR